MSVPPAQFDASILDRLACPACRGVLHLAGGSLVCAACGRSYPLVEGIPVLIAERAQIAPAAAPTA